MGDECDKCAATPKPNGCGKSRPLAHTTTHTPPRIHTHVLSDVTHTHAYSDPLHTHSPTQDFASDDMPLVLGIAIGVPLGAAYIAVHNGVLAV